MKEGEGGTHMVKEFHHEAYPDAARLLEKDFASFNLLARILHHPLDTILTDDKSFILTFSSPVYPVWVWTEENLSDETCLFLWNTLKERYPIEAGNRYNIKKTLSSRFLPLARSEGILASEQLQLLAYECARVNPLSGAIPGELYRCNSDDIDLLADWLTDFHDELGTDQSNREGYLAEIRERMESGAFFFWKVKDLPVSMCSYANGDGYRTVSHVYTPPIFRRNHYAESLVASVTEEILSEGWRALLYTDGGYPASNACYQKIGYRLEGSLVSFGLSIS